MSEKSFPQIFAGLSMIALALVIAAWLGGNALHHLKSADHVISVTGSARKAIRADLGIWRSSVTVEAPSREAAYQKLQADLETAKRFLLTQKQIPETAFSLGNLNTQPLMERLSNGELSDKVRAFRMTQNMEVRLNDVEKIQQWAQESQELLNQGLAFESSSPEYLYTKLSDLRVEMLAAASQDAQTRAQKIVESVHSQLGPVRSVQTGVFQITRPHSTEVSDYGMYDTSTIDKDITAVLTMTFAVR